MNRLFLATLVAAGLSLAVAPFAAFAQDEPPSYASQADEQIHGRIVAFDGGYNLQVRDDRGFVDDVQLHDGTIINPTGLTLAPGMICSIDGFNSGSYFAANEIDTPYTFYNAVPYYEGHPWNYWGPSISIGFFFGSGNWWHGGYHGYSGHQGGFGNGYGGYAHPFVGNRGFGAAQNRTGYFPQGQRGPTSFQAGHQFGSGAHPNFHATNGGSHGNFHSSGHRDDHRR